MSEVAMSRGLVGRIEDTGPPVARGGKRATNKFPETAVKKGFGAVK